MPAPLRPGGPAAKTRLTWRFAGMAEPDVAALVKQTEHLNLLVGSLRDEMRILSAVVLRLDNSMTAFAREMRAYCGFLGPL